MKSISRLTLPFLTLLLLFSQLGTAKKIEDPFIRQGVVVFKVAPEINIDVQLDKFTGKIDIHKIERTFPHCLPPVKGGTDLTRIYTVYFPVSIPVDSVCNLMNKLPEIEYAEPWFIDRPCISHNDFHRDRQYGLDLCEANRAHDIAIGDRTVPVAIVDTGIKMDHEDLVDNLWVNPGEDLNGDGVIQERERNHRDDDGNGVVDDFHGWDFVDEDNFPEDIDFEGYDYWGHGTHCSGIASAATNNEIGVASVGYSCGIMVIRAGDNGIMFGYQGIEYAARSGAKVINCSWGSGWGGRQGQDVINYAYEHDALVVAAAGNDNVDDPHYPSAYNHVVSVAATDTNDRKVFFSNYGNTVDISAPGLYIYSATVNGRYGSLSGTSMASPFAAGVAVLIRAAYPELSVDETEELLLTGADDINDENPGYRNQLGVGRINAYRSLDFGPRPKLVATSMDIVGDDNNDGHADLGETIEVAFRFVNDPRNLPAEDLVAYISSNDPSFVFEVGEVELPGIAPGRSVTNDDHPFIVLVSADTIPHTSHLTITVWSQARLKAVVQDFEIVIGRPDILIIDDDGGKDIESYYYESLESMEQGWVRWDVRREGAPEPEDWNSYGMVIWATGDADPPFDDDERQALEEALSNGANVLLTSKMIGNDEANHNLLEDYFGARHEADSVLAATVEGLPGDRIFPEDAMMFLFGHGSRRNGRLSTSSMQPVNGADSLLVYRYREPTTGLAGVYRIDEETGSRTIYFGFGFESISNVRMTRLEALTLLYEWFKGKSSVPLENVPVTSGLILEPAYPNPFNSATLIRWYQNRSAPVQIRLVDAAGRSIQTLNFGLMTPGQHHFNWQADSYPSGVYFCRLGCSDQTRSIRLVKLR